MPDISIQLIIGVIVVLMGLRDAYVANKRKAEAAKARMERERMGAAPETVTETGPQRSAWEEFGMDEEEADDEEEKVFEPVSRPEAPPPRPVRVEGPPRPLPVEAPPPRPVLVEAPPRPVVIAPPRTPPPFQFPGGFSVPSPTPRPQPAPYARPLSPTQRRDLSAGRARRGIPLDSRSARQAVVYMAVFGTPRGLDKDW
jgi:hypothetical protein